MNCLVAKQFFEESSEWSVKFGEDKIKLTRIEFTHNQEHEAVE